MNKTRKLAVSMPKNHISYNHRNQSGMAGASRVAKKSSERAVLFRTLVDDIPSTTYATFGLYRYPAKFIPQVIAYVLKRYGHSGMSVFDPFAGYGTVGVVARVYGYDYELWDLNPMLKHLHNVATMQPPKHVDIESLLSMMAHSQQKFVPDWANICHWYPDEVLPFLFKVWGFYHSLDNNQMKRLLIIPLLKSTRSLSYNDAQRQKLSRSPRSMDKVSSLIKQDWKSFFSKKVSSELASLTRRLNEYQSLEPKAVNGVVKAGIDIMSLDLKEERDILITSPPYMQAQEYMRASKMDLFWLGYPEASIKQLSKMEIPYREVESCTIYSETYQKWIERLDKEPQLLKVFQRYFWGVLGALTRLQNKVNSYLFLFVGSANIRGNPIPIHTIFEEHFRSLNWIHETTLKDTIVSRVMFSYSANPATGLQDKRMRNEYLVVLHKTH